MSDGAFSPQELVALAERIRQADPAAENELVRLFSSRVRVMMLARTRDPEAAQELVQEVLMSVVRALRNGQVRQAERLAGFVYGTARNLANNYLRTRRQGPREVSLPPELAFADGPAEVEAAEHMRLVQQALATLGITDRKILLMTMVEGLKPGEIATRLKLTPEAVRTRKSRAVKKVIQRIKKMSRK